MKSLDFFSSWVLKLLKADTVDEVCHLDKNVEKYHVHGVWLPYKNSRN